MIFSKVKKLTLKISITLIILLLFGDVVPLAYEISSQNKTEQQLEEISFSENYLTTSIKKTNNQKKIKILNLSIPKKYPTFTCLINFKTTTIIPKTCKYGWQVLYGLFLN